MYLTAKDICLCCFKSIIITVILFGMIALSYYLSSVYCEMMNIPKDLTLTSMSLGMVMNATIILFIIELFILHYLVKWLKQYKLFNKFYNFLSKDY